MDDPHVFPDFTSTSPRLYLPPLLSSLPAHIPFHQQLNSNAKFTETRLPDIDPASLSLHKALHHFIPVTANYAQVPYQDAFNWSELRLPMDDEREWYCVVFRSKRMPGSNADSLYDADSLAHQEAIQNGGLILYWYGIPNEETGCNLATCIWQSKKHAREANSRPHHIKAMKLAAASYQVYTLERYILRKIRGQRHVYIVPYEAGEVGW